MMRFGLRVWLSREAPVSFLLLGFPTRRPGGAGPSPSVSPPITTSSRRVGLVPAVIYCGVKILAGCALPSSPPFVKEHPCADGCCIAPPFSRRIK